jgi:hypothetical protein
MEWTNVWNNNLVEYYSIAEEKLRKKILYGNLRYCRIHSLIFFCFFFPLTSSASFDLFSEVEALEGKSFFDSFLASQKLDFECYFVLLI